MPTELSSRISLKAEKQTNQKTHKKPHTTDYCVIISGIRTIVCYTLGQDTQFRKFASRFCSATWKPPGWRTCLIFCGPLDGSAAPSQPDQPEALWKRQPGLKQPLTKLFFMGKGKMRNQNPRSPFFLKPSFGSSAHSIAGNIYQNQYINVMES